MNSTCRKTINRGKVNSSGNTTTTISDSNGNTIHTSTTTDANGNSTTVTTTSDSSGNKDSYYVTVDANGNVISNTSITTDSNGNYMSALRHFEVECGGLLPATADSVARYLADHATTLSLNTLRHRLAALSHWHQEHGFTDPTKASLVRQVLKGIRTVHAGPEKRARPLQLDVLQQVADWLERGIVTAHTRGDAAATLRILRDRALLLLGFWRGFRADELVNLRIEYLESIHGEGLICYLPRSKGDR